RSKLTPLASESLASVQKQKISQNPSLMSEPKRTSKERAADFVGALRRARNDRGKLAALRRGLTDNPRMHVDAWPVVASLGGDIGQPACVAIAAFFASHPQESYARNLGETCRRIAQGDG